MKSIQTIILTVLCGLILALFTSVPSHANPIDHAIVTASPDSDVVIAIHPYDSKKVRKEYMYRRGRRDRHLVPMGVLIQNFSRSRVAVSRFSLSGDEKQGLHVKTFSPYGKRASGSTGLRSFYADGPALNQALHRRYAETRALPVLSQNEAFEHNWIEPGTAYYGLVYLDRRDKGHRPRPIANLDALILSLHLDRGVRGLRDVAVIQLAEKNAQYRVAQRNEQPAESMGARFRYHGTRELSSAAESQLRVLLLQCLDEHVSEHKDRRWARVIGTRTWGRIFLDGRGRYASHQVLVSSDNPALESSFAEVMQDLQCDIPKRLQEDSGSRNKMFSFRITFGDSFVPSSSERKLVSARDR